MAIINVVIDLSHHNSVTDFNQVRTDGIAGVIHKATQGLHYDDPKYPGRRQPALHAGLMWGAYHFGIAADGVAQAQHFLSVVQPGPQDLLALDLEKNDQGNMSLKQAVAFVNHIFQETGRWPGLYGGDYIKELLRNETATILANCWLWLAQYGSAPAVPPAWPTWTMWQYTDGVAGPGPHTVAGLGPCDRDKFNGEISQLRQLWGYLT